MKTNKKWIRKCPKCNNVIGYSCKSSLNRAIKNNSLCKPCSKLGRKRPDISGKNHHFFDKKRPEFSGENHPMFGKK